MYKRLVAVGLSFIASTSALFGMLEVMPIMDVFHAEPLEVEYDRPLIVYPQKFNTLNLFYTSGIYYIEHEGKLHEVQNAFVDKKLRGISEKQLLKFWEGGYIAIDQYKDNEDFHLTAKTRGLGGGPFFAKFVWWTTRAVIYTTIATVGGAAVVSTGGAALGALGVGATASTAGAGAAAAIATAPIAGVVATTASIGTVAGAGAVGAVVAAASVGGTVAATEALAGGLATLAFLVPLP